jgi:hypothetical protein
MNFHFFCSLQYEQTMLVSVSTNHGWGTLGLLKGKMNREHNILEITKSSNALDNF